MASELLGLERVLRASVGRKTRFHTMRGDFVPLRAIAELPLLIVKRVAGREPDGPWINAPALRFLKRIIQPDWHVLVWVRALDGLVRKTCHLGGCARRPAKLACRGIGQVGPI